MESILYKTESSEIINCCYEVFNHLGPGFLESLYKDALMEEFKIRKIPFEREKQFIVKYKNQLLRHYYYADFVVWDKIILELKTVSAINDQLLAQGINYLKVSGNQLALIVNFGENPIKIKRVVLTKNYGETIIIR
ncbi:MAG: GxxExxY protein [Bacteroidia bacterium]|nr:GxxExxY protein [Bacteroidia bacterium]